VKDGHTTKSESSFGKKLWCVLIVGFLAVIGWQVWKLNAYNNAVREAKEAGFDWRCTDTFSLIRQDWHNALKKETWGAHERVLYMREVTDLGRYREMLHGLRPTELRAKECMNVDALKGLTSLQSLYLVDCPVLQNVDGLKGLTGLQTLYLIDCPSLQNVDGLEGHTGLQTLVLNFCPDLHKADALMSLTGLQKLVLFGSHALHDVDALKNLTGLKLLGLGACNKIPAAALRELRAALPNTDITFPDGTKNPPQ
jgi:hypothetical protein